MSTLRFAPATGDQGPTVAVIAEIGVNHGGAVDRAVAMIDLAGQAGADAVKFQFFHPDRLLSAEAELAGYQVDSAGSARELLAGLTLSIDDLRRLRAEAARRDLGFVVTPFSPDDVEDLRALGPDAVKIASPDAVNPVLLERAADLGVPMLISTGTCTLDELEVAARCVRATGGALLQCISSYPAPDEQAALGGIAALAERFGVPAGYSDHTSGTFTPALAVAAGACVIEKHLTDDRAAAGPDHAASQDLAGFADCVRRVRQAAAMLGPRAKIVQPCEQDVARVSRQSVCATRDLEAGHVLAAADLTVKRPGLGLPAARFKAMVGRTLARPVRADHLLREEDLVR